MMRSPGNRPFCRRENTVRLPATLLCLALFASAPAAQQTRTRHVFVAVYDKDSSPVIDLAAKDFTIKENGNEANVIRASVKLPARIALMVDNSDAMAASLNPVRNGVQAFIDAIPAEHEIVLLTTGRQLQVRIPPPGTDRKKLKDAVTRIYPDAGSPSVLLNGYEEPSSASSEMRPESGRSWSS
jgi:hypothetical protein